MARWRSFIVGLCALCVVVISASGAQSASAAGTGLSTCVAVIPEVGTVGFSDSECENEVLSKANYETRPFKWGVIKVLRIVTPVITGVVIPILLKSLVSGVTLSVEAKQLSGSGTISTNEVGGEVVSSGAAVVTLEEVSVIAPAGKGCEVEGGKIVTKELAITTAGQGMFDKFAPASGTVLASFKIKGCSISALNKEYKLEGSVKGVPIGTRTAFGHAETTSQGTLTLGGQKAGLEGGFAFSAAESGEGPFTPIGFKT